ncbi:Na+/H+-dicarboxylate symporter [Roseiarcus fermentans]|uniref:Na+/H+-dicarboxylate symporter n=2 Tax=Roseiarcus fermentans TaxID=1473586 RepID=A0A366F379_9HYPH|nr:Na+/H+-dicarboxylate symporter [Roseiarcus fermentans]
MIHAILAALVLGIFVGYLIFLVDPDTGKAVASYLELVSTLFLRLIKMIIAPLVFSTLVVGITHVGESNQIGRIFIKTMTWFIAASLVSLLLGLLMVNILRPGDALNIPIPDAHAATGLKTSALSLQNFVEHLVPRSIIEAMANNEILQIVVFSVFFGVAIASLGDKGKLIVQGIDELAHVMLIVTGYVMTFAPLAVFAAVAATVAKQGLWVLLVFAKFMGGFYLSLLLLWGLLALGGFLVLGPRVLRLLGMMRGPILLAFSTASSEAAYPKTLEALEQFGVPNRIASFVLPMGYSFNLDGSMMYCTFASLFIAQAYGVVLPLGTQLTMLLILMLTSKGMAGVPRASLVVIAATLNQFAIPEAGLLLIMGIDQFLDMGRSATNVVGNSIATAVVSRWEGALGEERPAGADDAFLDEPAAA